MFCLFVCRNIWSSYVCWRSLWRGTKMFTVRQARQAAAQTTAGRKSKKQNKKSEDIMRYRPHRYACAKSTANVQRHLGGYGTRRPRRTHCGPLRTADRRPVLRIMCAISRKCRFRAVHHTVKVKKGKGSRKTKRTRTQVLGLDKNRQSTVLTMSP